MDWSKAIKSLFRWRSEDYNKIRWEFMVVTGNKVIDNRGVIMYEFRNQSVGYILNINNAKLNTGEVLTLIIVTGERDIQTYNLSFSPNGSPSPTHPQALVCMKVSAE